MHKSLVVVTKFLIAFKKRFAHTTSSGGATSRRTRRFLLGAVGATVSWSSWLSSFCEEFTLAACSFSMGIKKLVEKRVIKVSKSRIMIKTANIIKIITIKMHLTAHLLSEHEAGYTCNFSKCLLLKQ